MSPTQWFVLIAGIAGIAWVNWYFFPGKPKAVPVGKPARGRNREE